MALGRKPTSFIRSIIVIYVFQTTKIPRTPYLVANKYKNQLVWSINLAFGFVDFQGLMNGTCIDLYGKCLYDTEII